MEFRLVILIAALLGISSGVPLRDNVKRDGIEQVVVYQEVLQIMAVTSTVYVDQPTPTSLLLAKSSDVQSSSLPPSPPSPPQPTTQAVKAASTAISTAISHESSSSDTYSGKATFYTPGMGSCGIESSDSESVVAISHGMMQAKAGANPNANPWCGKKISVTHTGTGKTVQATIVDTCPGC